METDRLVSAPPHDTVYFSIRELADLLGVTVSAVSHAVQKGHHLKGLYPVTLWAVRDERGRVVGFDVPAEAADVIAQPAPKPQLPVNDASTPAPLSVQPPLNAPPLARSDADYDRQARHFESLLERARLENDALRDDLRRTLTQLDDERQARRRDVDEMRERLAEQRETWADERQTFRDEAADLRTRLLTWESGASPEDNPQPSFWGQLLNENADMLAPLVQALTARLAAPKPGGVAVSAPATPPAETPAPPSPQAPQTPSQPDHTAILTAHLERLVQGVLAGRVDVVQEAVAALRAYPVSPDWGSAVRYGVDLLRANDPDGATARHLRPILEAVYPAALSMGVAPLQGLLSSYLGESELSAWASDLLAQGLEERPRKGRKRTESSDSKIL